MIIFTHRIADIAIRTESDVLIPYIRNNLFNKFQIVNVKPDIRLRICQFHKDSFILPPLSSYERWGIVQCISFPKRWLDNPIFRSPEVRKVVHKCIDNPKLVHIALNWNRAIFRNFSSNEVNLFYPPERKKDIINPIFRAGYRNLISSSLLNYSAVLIHGAGVIRNGNAAVFLAPDEGGKTTVINHITSGTSLSDDHIILRQQDDIVMVYGTPFGFITGEPKQARLGGLFFLEKSSRFELVPLKPRDVLQFIWNEQMYKWFVLPKALSKRAFEILYAACRQARVFRMRFPKNFVDWEALDKVLEG